jgi:SAM-dependent methyltransferase
MEMMLDKLSQEQVALYDAEFVDERGMEIICSAIDRHFPDGRFSFLDVGGGNGIFADRILDRYPSARGTVIDSSELMISKNAARPRKEAIVCDAAEVAARGELFDLIFCNLVLHHLVTTGSYRRTRENVERVLAGLAGCLSESGCISVYELEFNGLIDDFPGHAIFALTSSKVLAPVVKRLGGNTAGVGACFRSHRAWTKLFYGVGLDLIGRTRNGTAFPGGALKRRILLVADSGYVHYWLKPRPEHLQ